jgi:transcriptional regulator with XRE-family HTH domain
MEYHERLAVALELRGWSQGQLAARTAHLGARVSQSHISMILRGEREPGIKTMEVLARALGVSIDWLCGLPPREGSVLEPDEDALLKVTTLQPIFHAVIIATSLFNRLADSYNKKRSRRPGDS